MRVTLLALVFLALTGCTTVKSGHCGPFVMNPPSQAQIDAMTPDEKAKALAELMKFERICGP